MFCQSLTVVVEVITITLLLFTITGVLSEVDDGSLQRMPENVRKQPDDSGFKMETHFLMQGGNGGNGGGKAGPKGDKGDRGEQGPQGDQGPPGPSGGGAVYTRWGRTVCPNTNGTTRVYEGFVVGTEHNRPGGGANYLCITKEPEYLSSTVPKYSASDLTLTYLYTADYQLPGFDPSLNAHDVPCAICHTSQRSSKLMIPGKISCPTSWTEEYEGYLVAERSNHDNHRHSVVYECMDKDGETIPEEKNTAGGTALFGLVAAKCNVGIPCPKFVADRPITCVVCTK